MRKKFSILFIVSVAMICMSQAPQKYTYVYNEDIEGYQIQTKWIVEVQKDGLLIEGENPMGTTMIQCKDDYSLNKFIYNAKDSDVEYTLNRSGEELTAKGKINGKNRSKVHKIGDTPWIQEFGFGLRTFLLSDENNFKFCIVNPSDLGVVKMIAKKKKTETLSINGKEYSAQKVYVTLQGFKSMFWSADMWFDTKAQDLLMYQADQGPDTPFTIITFLEKN